MATCHSILAWKIARTEGVQWACAYIVHGLVKSQTLSYNTETILQQNLVSPTFYNFKHFQNSKTYQKNRVNIKNAQKYGFLLSSYISNIGIYDIRIYFSSCFLGFSLRLTILINNKHEGILFFIIILQYQLHISKES